MIVAGGGGTELFFLREASRDCVREEKIRTVSSMYPAPKSSVAGTMYLGGGVRLAAGTEIELAYESGQWIQRNLTTRKEIRLKAGEARRRDSHLFRN